MTMGLWASVGQASALADSLSVSLSNANPPDGAPITATFNATATAIDSNSDGPYLYAVIQPSSAGACGATYGEDMQVAGSQATTITSDSFNNSTQLKTGQSTTDFSFTAYSAGAYTRCGWIETVPNDYSNVALRSLARAATGRRLQCMALAPCGSIVFHAPSAGKLTVGYYQRHRHGRNLLVCSTRDTQRTNTKQGMDTC
jgi:hypothetical protein